MQFSKSSRGLWFCDLIVMFRDNLMLMSVFSWKRVRALYLNECNCIQRGASSESFLFRIMLKSRYLSHCWRFQTHRIQIVCYVCNMSHFSHYSRKHFSCQTQDVSISITITISYRQPMPRIVLCVLLWFCRSVLTN